MKRPLRRIALGAILALALAMGITFVGATRPRCDEALLGGPHATRTGEAIAREVGALRATGAAPAPLRAGWGRASIAPPLGTPTLGYAARFAKGIPAAADDVEAHALALVAGDGPPLVLLSAEICLWTGALSDRVAEALADRLPRERLYFGATHTHNGPSGFVEGPLWRPFFGARSEEATRRIVEGCGRAVTLALETLAPASYRLVTAPVPEHVENRFGGKEPVDDELAILEVLRPPTPPGPPDATSPGDGPSGVTTAAHFALCVYPAHATAISHAHVAGSGDWPGALVRGLRSRGFADAMVLAGPTGQAGPVLDGKPAYHDGVEVAYALGERLAGRVGVLLDDRAREASAPSLTATLWKTPWRDAASIRAVRVPLSLPPFEVRLLGRAVREDLVARGIGAEVPARGFLHVLRLDDALLLGLPVEASAVAARGWKARARERATRGESAVRALLVTSFNGDHHLYHVPDDVAARGGYESDMTLFGPRFGSYLSWAAEETITAASR